VIWYARMASLAAPAALSLTVDGLIYARSGGLLRRQG
jgi:hypothetical protein